MMIVIMMMIIKMTMTVTKVMISVMTKKIVMTSMKYFLSIINYNPSCIFIVCNWSKCVTGQNISQLRNWGISQSCMCFKKHWSEG